MATHDYNLANASGASFRADLNNALQAVLTNNSSASSPSTTAAYMFWADTNTGILKIRNSSNDAWVELLQLDGTLTLEDGSASAVALGFRDELNTGIFSSGANNFDVSIAGTTRLNISASGINITGTVTDDGATHDGDVTFTGASANIVFDKSDNALEFADNAKAVFGAGGDLEILHNGSNSIINDAGTGELILQRGGSNILSLTSAGVNITDPSGEAICQITGFEGSDAAVQLVADEGDDNGDRWKLVSVASTNTLNFQNNISGSNATKWKVDTSGFVTQEGGLHLGGQLLATNGTNSSPSLSFINSNTTGFFRLASNQIGVACGGTSRYSFTNNNFKPQVDDDADLGSNSLRFDNIFATNTTISTSDKNLKNTITKSDLGLDFINKLNPVSYKFNNKTRTHYGLIAQEIETVLGTISKSATDFAGFCKDEVDEDGNAMTAKYGLRYSEFISPIIKAIQELSAKVTALEGS